MFYKIINLIKINLMFKNKIIKIKLHKNDFNILKIFLKLNIIKSIKHFNKNYYILFLNNNNYYNNIINLYKPSKTQHIKYRNICLINKKKTNISILSTNKGLINNFEAEREKIGGILIMNLWF